VGRHTKIPKRSIFDAIDQRAYQTRKSHHFQILALILNSFLVPKPFGTTTFLQYWKIFFEP
jgi:hypothetical protein